MLVATAFQESHFIKRRQINGPAKGYWQFEPIGVIGVLEHPSTKLLILDAIKRLDYGRMSYSELHKAMEFDAILAAIFARLLLWQHKDPLPKEGETQKGWDYYMKLWRPGKPRHADWPDNFELAWDSLN